MQDAASSRSPAKTALAQRDFKTDSITIDFHCSKDVAVPYPNNSSEHEANEHAMQKPPLINPIVVSSADL
jgi:hypothetical protein